MPDLVWPELYFVRHGETDWNAEGRYQGSRDIPLNNRGRGQAELNGKLLSQLLNRSGRAATDFTWYVSPLGRTRETMDRVRAGFDMHLPEVQYDVRLMEISFGVLEGSLFEELPATMAVAPGRRDATYWDYRPENGENYRDVEARLNAFASVLKGPSVVVAHGGIARTLRVLIERAPILDVINWAPPQDVVMHFTPGRMELLRA